MTTVRCARLALAAPRVALSLGLMAAAAGCATPAAIPPGLNAPSIVLAALPLAHEAIFDWANDHDDVLPVTSAGEALVLAAVKTRSSMSEELDAGGNLVETTETIDGLAYAYRPAHEQCVLAVAGHIVRRPKGGGAPMCAWYCYKGRYTSDGVILPDETTYYENAELFVDAMRGTSHQVPWNSSAWGITRIFEAVSAAQGAPTADRLADQFVSGAIATGRARVPTGMPPRKAAFGGVSGRGSNGPTGTTTATPPSDT